MSGNETDGVNMASPRVRGLSSLVLRDPSRLPEVLDAPDRAEFSIDLVTGVSTWDERERARMVGQDTLPRISVPAPAPYVTRHGDLLTVDGSNGTWQYRIVETDWANGIVTGELVGHQKYDRR